tara:strand:+ start:50 stop:853 length:804 start_codon:yes stop_codon:yes gene_type:complete
MKTAIDAVNKFKGKWPDDTKIIECSCFDFVCTKGPFIDLVLQMETNFGKCDPVLAAYYRHVTDKELLTKSTKELEVMDIDWSETECEFALVNNNSVMVEFFEREPETSNCEECWMVSTSTSLYLKNAWVLIEKPQPTLTYTQAMADNGELPSVGMECRFDTTFFTTVTSNRGTCEIIAYYDGKVWINIIDFDCVINLNVIDFKPLTPPIELIAKSLYLFTVGKKEDMVGEAYFTAIDEDPMITNIRTNTSYSQDACTNIQPLTVEVK